MLILMFTACHVYSVPCELEREPSMGVRVCFTPEPPEPECVCDAGADGGHE